MTKRATTRPWAFASLVAFVLLSRSIAVGATIGPDGYGYYATNSISSAFQDISQTGSYLLAGDDNATSYGVSFNVLFYGQSYSTIFINTNGLITFQTGTTSFSNVQMNSLSQPSVAVLWDDWAARGTGSGVYTQVTGSGPNRELIVQWHEMERFSSSPSTVTFQAVFRENGDILFRYRDTLAGNFSDNGGDSTIGITNGAGTSLQWSFNQQSVFSGDAILFTTSPPTIPEPSTIVIATLLGIGGFVANRSRRGNSPA